jgi:hypothetical protein
MKYATFSKRDFAAASRNLLEFSSRFAACLANSSVVFSSMIYGDHEQDVNNNNNNTNTYTNTNSMLTGAVNGN